MPTITKTIGTAGRDYSTISAWEADLDNGAIYTAGDEAVGLCYNDSLFTNSVTLNGGLIIGLISATLKPATNQGHTGIANTGVRIITPLQGTTILVSSTTVAYTVIGLDITSTHTTANLGGISTNATNHTCNRMIIHDYNTTASLIPSNCSTGTQINNIMYNMLCTGTGSQTLYGIQHPLGGNITTVMNNTIYNLINNNGTGNCRGVWSFGSTDNRKMQNNIVVSISGTTTGSIECFNFADGGVRTNNISSDTTATGTDSQINITAASLFLSTVPGGENLHLKTGAPAIGTGIDLETTPVGVQFDIDGYDRDASGVVWDVGADQFGLGNFLPKFIRQYYHRYLGRME
jgi:hypothetical protein